VPLDHAAARASLPSVEGWDLAKSGLNMVAAQPIVPIGQYSDDMLDRPACPISAEVGS